MKSRNERRKKARQSKVAFAPQYNGATLMTYQEFHGVGYERFNSKYVKIKA